MKVIQLTNPTHQIAYVESTVQQRQSQFWRLQCQWMTLHRHIRLHMLITLQEHKIWEHLICHSGTVWAHEESTLAEDHLYRCRGGWAAEDLFRQVMEYFEIGSDAKAEAKDLTIKAKAKDLSLEAKAKDMLYCPRGTSRPRTCPWGL